MLMPLVLTWEQITFRILLACAAGFIIGINRDEQGHPAGIRTTMLVCLAATLAMLQVNLLLPLAGKLPNSFVVMDLMRLPLGILSGIGFIGGGVILKREQGVSGITTAATMWTVTVLGLLFGGGNLYLGIAGTVITFIILWALKSIERKLPHERRGSLHVSVSPDSSTEDDLRQVLLTSNRRIARWQPRYQPPRALVSLKCELKWRVPGREAPGTPVFIDQLRKLPGITSLTWEE
jgi:putative Mg2+ transporter-C (MgtC) family protein